MIRHFLDVSTGHITDQDDRLFKADAYPIDVLHRSYGYFVWVPPDYDMKEYLEMIKGRGFSRNLLALLIAARQADCDFILFDGDGAKIEGYETFEW